MLVACVLFLNVIGISLFLIERWSIGSRDYNGCAVYLPTMKDKLSELTAIGITLDKELKLALIYNDITERFRYHVVFIEQQDLDFDKLSARLVEEAERYLTSPESGIAGGTVGVMAKRGKSRIAPAMKCFYCG